MASKASTFFLRLPRALDVGGLGVRRSALDHGGSSGRDTINLADYGKYSELDQLNSGQSKLNFFLHLHLAKNEV